MKKKKKTGVRNNGFFVPSATNRRDFLKLSALTAGSTMILNACKKSGVRHVLPYLAEPAKYKPFDKKSIATSCMSCKAACPAVVTTINGHPVRIDGNPSFPLTGGGLCPTGLVSVVDLYRKERLNTAISDGKKQSIDQATSGIKSILEAQQSSGKQGWFVAPVLNSISETRLIREFCQKYKLNSLFYDWSGHATILDAYEDFSGNRISPFYKFHKARLVISFADDALHSGAMALQNTALWSSNKEENKEWVQVESGLSQTGIVADKRIAISVADTGQKLAELLELLQQRKSGFEENLPVNGWLQRIADKLWDNRGRSIFLCGINDRDFQKTAIAINALLENYGRTIDTQNTAFTNESRASRVEKFLRDVRAGQVQTLVIFNSNPVADFHLDDVYSNIKDKVGLFTFENHTSRLCNRMLPVSHFLESYSDHLMAGGYGSLSQPVVNPIFKTLQTGDYLLRLMGKNISFKTYLEQNWKKGSLGLPYETITGSWSTGYFRRSISKDRGHIKDKDLGKAHSRIKSAFKEKLYLISSIPTHMKNTTYDPDPVLWELPRGSMSVSWNVTARVSPELAEQFSLQNEDEIKISANEQEILVPVILVDGMSGDIVELDTGFGREVEDYISPGIIAIKSIKKTGRNVGMSISRPGKLEPDLTKSAGNFNTSNKNMTRSQRQFPFHHWAMAIDLQKCTGCKSCVVSCQLENNIPVVGRHDSALNRQMHWLRFQYFNAGEDYTFIPINCQHCDAAPCEPVCPVAATGSSIEGINQQTYQRCIGARFCSANCPYEARLFNYRDYVHDRPENSRMTDRYGRMSLNPEVTVREKGMIEKCSLCVHRIQEAKYQAKKEDRKLRDGDIRLACQQSCPAGAILFGDINDPVSEISIALQQKPAFRLFESQGTEPSVYYFYSKKIRKAQNG